MSIQKFLQITVSIIFSGAIATFNYYTFANDATYYFAKAKIQYANQMYNYAIENLERTLMMDSTHYEAANLLATIYLKHHNDKTKALGYLLMSIAINDNQPDIHHTIGTLYYFFNDYTNAKKHLHRALSLRKTPYTHYYLALVYTAIKEYTSAAFHINQCNALTNAKVQVERKMAFDAKVNNNYNQAIVHYINALAINPASKEVSLELVHMYRMQNKLDEAIAVLENCKKIYVYDADVLLTLAHLYLEYRHPKRRAWYIKQAIELCNAVIAKDQGHCEAYSLLYEIYSQLGDTILRDENEGKYNSCVDNKSN